jgi:hypothetical protein
MSRRSKNFLPFYPFGLLQKAAYVSRFLLDGIDKAKIIC